VGEPEARTTNRKQHEFGGTSKLPSRKGGLCYVLNGTRKKASRCRKVRDAPPGREGSKETRRTFSLVITRKGSGRTARSGGKKEEDESSAVGPLVAKARKGKEGKDKGNHRSGNEKGTSKGTGLHCEKREGRFRTQKGG